MYIDTHLCGGSLIHVQYVLTAAHCTNEFPAEFLLVRAGSSYINQDGYVKQVVQIYQYPNFDESTLDNDVSVVKVESSFELGYKIQPIPLPLQDEPISDSQIGVVTGWGRLSDNGAVPFELQQLQVPIINIDTCKSLNSGMTEHMFCAGYVEGGKDTCQGDSGGPLAIGGTLMGITSWGDGCALPNHPGVYTKVSSFVNYINSILYNNQSINISV